MKKTKKFSFKHALLSFCFLLLAGTTMTFAAENITVSSEVQSSFQKEFADAKVINWSEEGDFLKATFLLQGVRTVAYFSQQGEYGGSMRAVLPAALPLAVISTLDKRFSHLDIMDATEINNANGTSYRVTVKSGNKKFRTSVDAAGNLSDVEKIKK